MMTKQTILRQSKISSSEYQAVKNLKAFKKEDWAWNSDEGLYLRSTK